MHPSHNNDSFVTISNNQIYEKLVTVEKKLDITNGKVKLTRWIATTALSLAVLTIAIVIEFLSRAKGA